MGSSAFTVPPPRRLLAPVFLLLLPPLPFGEGDTSLLVLSLLSSSSSSLLSALRPSTPNFRWLLCLRLLIRHLQHNLKNSFKLLMKFPIKHHNQIDLQILAFFCWWMICPLLMQGEPANSRLEAKSLARLQWVTTQLLFFIFFCSMGSLLQKESGRVLLKSSAYPPCTRSIW